MLTPVLAVLLKLIYNLHVKGSINYGHHGDIRTQRTSSIRAEVLQKPFVDCFIDVMSQLFFFLFFFFNRKLFLCFTHEPL